MDKLISKWAERLGWHGVFLIGHGLLAFQNPFLGMPPVWEIWEWGATLVR